MNKWHNLKTSMLLIYLRKQCYGKAFILEYIYYIISIESFSLFTNYNRIPKLQPGIKDELYVR